MRSIFLCCFILTSTLNAQIYMMGVAPLKPGNYWKYVDVGGMFSDTQCYEVTDSTRNLLGLNFNIVQSFGSPSYIRYSGYKMLTTDSTYIKYTTYVPDSIYTYYKANCRIGESWIEPVNEFITYTFSVIDTFHISAWGHNYFTKLIKITDFNGTEVYQVWADHLGLMEEQGVGQYHMVLRGCVIDGVIYGDTTTIVSVDDVPENPNSFQLFQNYPNPFNPSTTIKYSIASPNLSKGEALVKVSMIIYDILGNKVVTLVNKEQTPGIYEVSFDASALSSGVYLYTIKAGSFVQTKKMLLMK